MSHNNNSSQPKPAPNNNKNQVSIDWNFIKSQENSKPYHTEGYVPKSKKTGKVIGQSGVTIATGADLGQQNERELRKVWRLPEPLITKLKPYLGKKREEAAAFLEKNPLTITKKDCETIDAAVKAAFTTRLENDYNKQAKGRKFSDLPTAAQTVLYSIKHQYYNFKNKENKRILEKAVQGDVNGMIDILSKSQSQYKTRRRAEGNYLRENANKSSGLLQNNLQNTQNLANIGGVSLDIDVNLLLDPLNYQFRGLNIDVQNNRFNLILSDSASSNLLSITNTEILLSDLIVPLKVFYDPQIKNKSISFSLDPFEPNNPHGDYQKKVYFPDKLEGRSIIQGTKFGEIMFEADFIMKQMALGVTPININSASFQVKEFEFPQELLNLGLKPCHKYNSNMNNVQANQWHRMWIVVKDLELLQLKTEYDGNYHFFKDIKMGVEVQCMKTNAQGALEDDKTKENGSSERQFVEVFTRIYDKICCYYPCFKRLKEMSKAAALAKYMFENSIPVDLELINSLFQQQKTENVDVKVPSLRKKYESQQENMIRHLTVFGGVALSTDTHVTLDESFLSSVDPRLKPLQMPSSIQVQHVSCVKMVQFPFAKKSLCEECDERLTMEEMLYPEKGKCYCGKCHPNACCCCYEIFKGGSRYFILDGMKFHSECFVCGECDEPMDGNYVKSGGMYLHPYCYEIIQAEEVELVFIGNNGYNGNSYQNQEEFKSSFEDQEDEELQKAIKLSLQPLVEEKKQQNLMTESKYDKTVVNENNQQKDYDLEYAIRLSLEPASNLIEDEDYLLAKAIQESLKKF